MKVLLALVLMSSVACAQDCQRIEYAELQAMAPEELREKIDRYESIRQVYVKAFNISGGTVGYYQGMAAEHERCTEEVKRMSKLLEKR